MKRVQIPENIKSQKFIKLVNQKFFKMGLAEIIKIVAELKKIGKSIPDIITNLHKLKVPVHNLIIAISQTHNLSLAESNKYVFASPEYAGIQNVSDTMLEDFLNE